ncbi:8255_t:CDS:2, partial [Dentiscutata erythropus]
VGSTADVLEKIDINEKTKIRLAIEELDGMLKKDNNQMDKGVRVLKQRQPYVRKQLGYGLENLDGNIKNEERISM